MSRGDVRVRSISEVNDARSDAEARRNEILLQVSDAVEHDGPGAGLRLLIALMARGDPTVGTLRLWRIDGAMFGTNRDRALRTIRRARMLCDDRTAKADGFVTLGWALESREDSKRMTSWMWELMRRETDGVKPRIGTPRGFPFAQLYDPRWNE